MRRKTNIEMKAGIFLFVGLAIAMVSILSLGGGNFLFEKNAVFYVEASDVAGLAKGAVIRSGGLKIGRVGNMEFSENYETVRITMLVNEAYRQRVRSDSLVRFQTQGVLGDKYLEILGGTKESPPAENKSLLQAEAPKDLSTMLADGQGVVQLLKENLVNLREITSGMAQGKKTEHMMRDLAETAANFKDVSQQLKTGNPMGELASTMKNLRSVSEKMKNGEGTIGALFNDASLYEDLKNLIGGANRNNVLKFFVRQAVKSSDEAASEKEEKAEKAKGKAPASKK